MPLIMNLEDVTFADARFVRELNILEHRTEFIREMARAILADYHSFESAWTIANRVYDRHCSSQAGCLNRRLDRPARTALSA